MAEQFLASAATLEAFAAARVLTMSDSMDTLPIGIYVVPSQAVRDHLGLPGLGTLTVYSGTHAGTAQFITNNTVPQFWVRSKSGGAWNDWHRAF